MCFDLNYKNSQKWCFLVVFLKRYLTHLSISFLHSEAGVMAQWRGLTLHCSASSLGSDTLSSPLEASVYTGHAHLQTHTYTQKISH